MKYLFCTKNRLFRRNNGDFVKKAGRVKRIKNAAQPQKGRRCGRAVRLRRTQGCQKTLETEVPRALFDLVQILHHAVVDQLAGDVADLPVD